MFPQYHIHTFIFFYLAEYHFWGVISDPTSVTMQFAFHPQTMCVYFWNVVYITLNSSCATKFLFILHLWWEKMGKSCHQFRRLPYFWASLTIERVAQSICCDTWHKIITSTTWWPFLSLQVFLECTVNNHFVIHPSLFNKFLLFCLIEHQFSCIIPYREGLFECGRKWP